MYLLLDIHAEDTPVLPAPLLQSSTLAELCLSTSTMTRFVSVCANLLQGHQERCREVVLEALGCATERLLMELAEHIRTLGGPIQEMCQEKCLSRLPAMHCTCKPTCQIL